MIYKIRPQLAEDIYGLREEPAELTKKQIAVINEVKRLQLREDIGNSLTELLDI